MRHNSCGNDYIDMCMLCKKYHVGKSVLQASRDLMVTALMPNQ